MADEEKDSTNPPESDDTSSDSPPIAESSATPPPPPPSDEGESTSGTVSQNRTIMLVLSYLGIFALLPLLIEKDDQEVQWHAKQGLILTGAWFAIFIALTVLVFIPVIGWILGCASALLPIVILVIHIILMVKAINGDRVRVPLVSDWVDQWN